MPPHEQKPLFDPNSTLPEPVRIEISEPEPVAETGQLPSIDNYDPYLGIEGITDADKEDIERLIEGGQFTRAGAEINVLGHTVEREPSQPPARTVNHHPGRRPEGSRRGLGAMGRLTADGPPSHIAEEMRIPKFPPIDSEAAERARQMIDGETNDTPDQT